MDKLLISYTVKPKKKPHVWIFKYDLEGNLKNFDVLGGMFTDDVVKFLFNPGTFPHHENVMKRWETHFKKTIEIIKGEVDLSFKSFWDVYNYKHGKKAQAEKTWSKLSKKDKINVLISISKYDNHLRLHVGQSKAYPNTYLNGRYWENYIKEAA